MFFFFAGGIQQQVTQILKTGASKCIVCGSKSDLVEYEKVLKLFFIPVYRWPGKEPLMHCNNCNLFFPQSISSPSTMDALNSSAVLRCRSCDRRVEAQFRFCPFCGTSL
ncbi:hypothetical protein ACHQM5_022820 [Ranunculus cassubicifolius]